MILKESGALFFLTCCSALLGNVVSIEDVVEQHLSLLQNLDAINPSLIVCFSATAGMGKTALAKKIESQLNAVRINLDDGRILLKKNNLYPMVGAEKGKIDYIMHYIDLLISRLKTLSRNHLIIIDDTVDRMYDPISSLVKKQRASLFLIRLVVSKSEAVRRIILREQDPAGYLANIDRWYNDYLEFNQRSFDYIFDNEGPFQEDLLLSLIQSISERLNVICERSFI